MTVTKIIALLLVLATITLAQDCQVSLSQQQRSSWTSNGNTYTLYDVTVLNSGSSTVTSVSVATSSSFQSFWEMQQKGDQLYILPDFRNIAAGASHQFGYIIVGSSPAEFQATASCTSAEASTEASAEVPAPAPAQASNDASAEVTEQPAVASASGDSSSDDSSSDSTEEVSHSSSHKETTTTTTKSPKHTTTTTTKAPKHTTSTTTKAPKTTTTTTKAPSHTTSTTTKSPSHTTSTTTKKPSTSTTTTTTKAPSGSGSDSENTVTGSPVNSGGCASGQWWKPAPGTTWQWQLTGTIDQSINVQMYDIDLFDSTPALISQLHAKGRVVICYFSTQYENWRPDASDFTAAVMGHALDGWEGEAWVDIRSPIVRNIMKNRMALAKGKGCDGLEPDNVDGYSNDNGLGLTAADQINFNQFIAETAHSYGLSVGLKNDVDQAATLEPYFDWALNEQCFQYSECDTLDSFITAGKAVFNCEYKGTGASVCPSMIEKKFSSLIKTLDLTAAITAQCCTYGPNGCVSVPSSCGSSASPLLENAEPQFNDVNVFQLDSSASSLSHTLLFLVFTLALALLF